jgi:hypothetical protein
MAESAIDRAEAMKTVSVAAKDLDPAAQVLAVQAVVPPPDSGTTKTLWIILVSGLIGLLVIALGGLIYLLADSKSPDVALTAFTAVLTGLVGLFSPSPVKSGGSSGGAAGG